MKLTITPLVKKQNHRPTVLEICCGMGGARKAFQDADFEVVQSIDIDPLVCDFYEQYWGDVNQSDITRENPKNISKADVLSAGFPCQPFSTSGYRTGFDHHQGNVFTALMALVDEHQFPVVFLENVQGLLSNDKNRTFKYILSQLAQRYNVVEWVTFNLLSLGIPMNRPRLVILAHNFDFQILQDLRPDFFVTNTTNMFPETRDWSNDLISDDSVPNQPTGTVIGGEYLVEKYEAKEIKFSGNLMDFIFGEQIGDFQIESGRFWGRTGKTIFYTSKNQYSHSVGTSMGGAPTFGFSPEHLNKSVLSRVEEVSNYQTEHSDKFVFRTKPEETLKFFGPKAQSFYDAIKLFEAPLAAKYKLLGNMFAPDQAFVVTDRLNNAFARESQAHSA